MDNISKYKMGI